MYDVIVVGARCAGSPTALLFARAGYRVLLLEKVRFPQDTLSSHYIHQPGVALLDQWGLLGKVRAAGTPPLDHASYEASGAVRVDGCSLPDHGQRAAFAPRRFVLDPILAEGAVAAGVEYREGCKVIDLLYDGGRVVGVKGTEGDKPFSERARLVIGADGMRSNVARLLKVPMTIEDPRMTCTYYSYWEGLPSHFELYERPGRWVAVIPSNHGRTLVMTYFPQNEFGRVRFNVKPEYLEAIRTTAPTVYDRLASATHAEQMYGTGDQRNFFRQASGPGWALVGDAAHHKDSIAARGITDAFHQAKLLTELVGEDLGNPAALDAALGRYTREVEERFADFYRSTLTVAELRVPEDRIALLQRIAGNQPMVDRYFATLSGACEIDDFYNAELLELLAVS
ncbi:NAD(P)/FAD-dependent oxidoreductase [Nonomuraea sp. NPDC002799]